MNNQHDFFVARATEARRDADNASLDNVRDRCIRAATAWEAMADRAKRAERHRVADAERKAGMNNPMPLSAH